MTHAQQNADRLRPSNKRNTTSTPSTTTFSLSSLLTTSSFSNPRRFYTRIFFLTRPSLIKLRGEEGSALLQRLLESLIFRGLMGSTFKRDPTISWPRPSPVPSCGGIPIDFLALDARPRETLGHGLPHMVREWPHHPTPAPRLERHPIIFGAQLQGQPDLSAPLWT